MSRVETP
jgi:hypothetical protein